MAIAVTVLVDEPVREIVSGVTGGPEAMPAMP